jgi:adenylate cyclase
MAAPRVDRRLAAIMAVDVVGYSRLIGADEAGTLARVKAHRIELAEPLIAEHHGRVVKLTGDGALVEFASAVDAVECAVAIQNGMAEREAAEPEERRIRYRIGINIGDIVLEDGDIFGDGVNVAARLEGLAEPGGICIARNVYNQVKGKLDLAFEPMGEHRVKNIAEPITVYRVLPGSGGTASIRALVAPVFRRRQLAAAAVVVLLAAGATGAWYALWRSGPEPPATAVAEAKPALPLPGKPSIAVLPFENLSGDPEHERLADGVTEDIITDLSRFRELFVIARNSTFVYKDKPADVRQIARELGVQYVLEGSLQADNDRVRITAQLIDATTGNHVWSERYDRPLDDVFAIQDEVTHTISASLAGVHGSVARAHREIARRKPPENLQAYEYYTLGMEHKHQFTEQDNKKARELFQGALQLDPNFARAYVGLAWTHNLDIDFGWTRSRQQSLVHWVAAARRAIAADPYDSEARTALGTYYQYLNDFPRAAAEIDRSLELNPNDADRLAQAAWYYTRGGQPERSLVLMERAVRLNPHHPDWYGAAWRETYFHNRRFEETIAVTKKRLYPDPIWDPLYRAMSYAQLGRDEEAAVEVKQVFVDQPDYSVEKWLNDTGTYAREGDLKLFLDSNQKAALPLCATEAQLAKYPDMKRLEQCEQQRASG